MVPEQRSLLKAYEPVARPLCLRFRKMACLANLPAHCQDGPRAYLTCRKYCMRRRLRPQTKAQVRPRWQQMTRTASSYHYVSNLHLRGGKFSTGAFPLLCPGASCKLQQCDAHDDNYCNCIHIYLVHSNALAH